MFQPNKIKRLPAKGEKFDSTWDMRKRYEQATLKCEFCGDLFNTCRLYHDHARLAHYNEVKSSWHTCTDCNTYYPTTHELKIHKSKVHSKLDLRDSQGRLACEFCPKTYLNMLDYNKHCHKDHYPMIKQEWISCPDCELCFRNPMGLRKHRHQRHITEESKNREVVLCSFCPKQFTRTETMHMHANRYHLDQVEKDWFFDPYTKSYKPTKLPDDDGSYADLISRGIKIRRSQGPKIWCEFCSVVVTYSLIPHANSKHADIISKIWLECAPCKMYFPTEKSLNSHKMSKHWSADGTPKKKKVPRGDVFQCQFCDEKFSYRLKYWSHAQKLHYDLIAKSWLQCQKCDALVPDAKAMAGHIGGKHARLDVAIPSANRSHCEFCTATFSKPRSVIAHALNVHMDIIKDKWIQCPDCSYLGPTEQSIFSHRIKIHHVRSASNTVICEFCPDSFCGAKRYVQHATKYHLDKVANTWEFCAKCQLYFPPKSHSHTGEKISRVVECKYCYQTITRTSINKHCNQEHVDQIADTWFQCAFCLFYFSSSLKLEKHQHTCKSKGKKVSATRVKVKRERKPRAPAKRRGRAHNNDDEDEEEDDNEDSKVAADDDSLPLSASRPRRKRAVKRTYYEEDNEEVEDFNFDDYAMGPVVKIEERNQYDPDLQVKKELDYASEEDAPLSIFNKRAKKGFKVKTEEDFEDFPEANENENDNDDNDNDNDIDNDFGYDQPEQPAIYGYDYDTYGANLEGDVGDSSWPLNDDDLKRDSLHRNGTDKDSLGGISSSADKYDKKSSQGFMSCPMKIDFDKLPVQESDFDNTGVNRRQKPKSGIVTSSRKNATYAVPVDQTEIKLVTSFDKDGTETKRVQCDYCSKSHINTSIYIGHVNKDHQELAMLYWVPCDGCGKYYPSDSFLKRHKMAVHAESKNPHKRVLCNFCSKMFGDSAVFYRHVKKKHYEEACKTWVKCKLCDSIMPHETAMYSHVLSAHPKYHKRMRNLLGKRPSGYERIECVCDYCGGTHGQRSRLLGHLKDKHPEKVVYEVAPHKCNHCESVLDNMREYIDHNNKVHPNEIKDLNWIPCGKCQTKFPTETIYAVHRAVDNCYYVSRPPAMPRPGTNGSGLELQGDRVKCPYCDMTFSNARNFYYHANKYHKEDLRAAGWDQCTNCQKFIPHGRLEYHMNSCKATVSIDEDRQFCQFCPMGFQRKSNLINHTNIRHKDLCVESGWQSCPRCLLYFPDEVTRNFHAVRCQIKMNDVAGDDDPEYKFQCRFCPRKSKTHGNHFRHMTSAHREKLLEANWYPCINCDKCFVSMTRQLRHQEQCVKPKIPGEVKEVKDKKAKCEFCSKIFFKGQMYYLHANKAHRDKIKGKWIKCSNCENSFPDISIMRRHKSRCILRTTKGSSMYNCDYCELQFQRVLPYTRHANNLHLRAVIEDSWQHCKNCNTYLPKVVKMKKHLIGCLLFNNR